MPDPDWGEEIRRRLAPARLDPAREVDLVRELAQHLEDRYYEARSDGASHEQACAAALDELASGDLAEELRAIAGRPHSDPVVTEASGHAALLTDWWQDVRFALRLMRNAPGFTTVAVVTLAIGIGGNSAIFTIVNAAMLRSLPFTESDRLVRVYESNPERGWPTFSVSHPNYLDWVQQARSFEQLAATAGVGFTLSGLAQTERVTGLAVTHTFLPALGIAPALGRNFLAEEDQPRGQPRVAIVSHGFWRDRLGGDVRILQRTVTLNQDAYTIVGVLPEHFVWGTARFDVLVPLAPDPSRSRGDHRLLVIGRLQRGVSLDVALADLKTIASRLEQQYPASNKGWTVRAISFYDWLVPEESRRSLLMFLAAVACVLLIACSNVANLMLARAAVRHREMSLRVALGARRGRLIRQLVVEAVLLATLGGAAGLVLSFVSTALLKTMATGIPRIDELSMDWRVLGFVVVVALGAGLLFGVPPALRASRTDVNDALKEGARGGASLVRHRLQSALVIVEAGLSVALLVGAGLLVRSFWRVQQVDPGFNAHRVLAMRVSVPEARYDSDEKAWRFYEELMEGMRALPGVQAVAATSLVPLAGGGTSSEVSVRGRQDAEAEGSADWRIVSPGYFRTMGIPLRGREFTAHDNGAGTLHTIVSEALARRYWPGEDPIGKQITVTSLGRRTSTVVGVAADVRSGGLDAEVKPVVYFPLPAVARAISMRIVVRTTGDPAAIAPAARGVLRSIDPGVPLFDVTTVDDLLTRSIAPRRFRMFLLACFAGAALLMAFVGLFGVMAYIVSQRTHEIGVRLALGAQPFDVFRSVVGRGLLLALEGIVAGLAAAYWTTPLLTSMLFGVEASDRATFIAAPAVLLAVSAVACYIPARRAMRVDPLVALRHE